MKAKLKLLIVEDETIIAENLKRILLRIGYKNVFVANSYNEGEQILLENNIDLALIDINLGLHEKTGIELAALLKEEHAIPFIYITANSDNLTLEKAKPTKPLAYLLKPFDRKNIESTLEIIVYNEFTSTKKIKIKGHSGTEFLNPEDITHVKSDGAYLEIFTSSKRYVHRASLKHFLEELPEFFMQVHKSFLVNLNKIQKVKSNQVLLGEIEIPLGRNYKNHLQERV